MRIFDWPQFTAGVLRDPRSGAIPETALTIGVFDGVHRGHQALINKITARPALVPLVITFKTNPKEFLRKKDWEGDILSLNRKLVILDNLGAAAVILIDFSEKFSRLGGKEFFGLLKKWGNPAYLVIGNNFRCGYRTDTDAVRLTSLCAEAGVKAEVAAPVLEFCSGRDLAFPAPHPVSSSRIRAAIAAGELSRAAGMLGRRVEFDCAGLASTVRQEGRLYPTASLNRIKPALGRYEAFLFGKSFPQGRAAEVAVQAEGIVIPSRDTIERIEFIERSAFWETAPESPAMVPKECI